MTQVGRDEALVSLRAIAAGAGLPLDFEALTAYIEQRSNPLEGMAALAATEAEHAFHHADDISKFGGRLETDAERKLIAAALDRKQLADRQPMSEFDRTAIEALNELRGVVKMLAAQAVAMKPVYMGETSYEAHDRLVATTMKDGSARWGTGDTAATPERMSIGQTLVSAAQTLQLEQESLGYALNQPGMAKGEDPEGCSLERLAQMCMELASENRRSLEELRDRLGRGI